MQTLCKNFDRISADVVACARVLLPGIAESDNKDAFHVALARSRAANHDGNESRPSGRGIS